MEEQLHLLFPNYSPHAKSNLEFDERFQLRNQIDADLKKRMALENV